ncbi:MAG: winged helix-turn-helix domain-containing tetratricopeptide repeat protein [Sulfuricaulis sp.]|uniref:winged helix-turn-helix domain-containing protein n=1 Tax=Sulfuricaulis sp. TaxID=2003553 RepID=UPI0034A2AB9A
MRAKRLRFDRYVLDLDRGCLLLDGNEIALRPKTFAVLHYLIENAGRLVSKDDLFAAVWPNLVITDDALVQSIGELRRALGDDGPRLITTIPRRGYRFESDVSAVAAVDQFSVNAAPILAASGDEVPSPEIIVKVRTPLSFFTTASTDWRIGLFVSFTFAGLLAAGVLWSGIASDWRFLHVLGYGDRSAIKNPAIGAKPSVAVLPLVNQSDDSGREYFADGLTQDIINALGRFSALTVISWNGVFPYKGKPASPEAIGRDLAVTYLVEGSVRQIGDRVRVSAQLVDTRQGRVLWSARFDEALADVFALQDNITTQIVSALAIRVAQIEQRRVFAKPTESLEAYDYVLRARPAFQRPTRANNVEARVLLRRAIELDPNYAAAYAALAETYHIGASMGWAESPTATLSRAEELAIKALSLDHSEVRARVILARIHIFHQRYKQAEAEIERAIAINPNDAQSLAGRGNILMWLGQTDAAIEALEQAQRIDPDLNTIDRFALGLAYYLKGRYDAAIEQAELNLRESAGANFNRIVLAAAYTQQHRTEDATRVVAEIHRIDPTFDPQEFGTKFLNAADLKYLRDGLSKAGLYPAEAGATRPLK